MMFYNKTLFQQAGLTMPHNPTWAQIQGFAAKLNQPGKVAGSACAAWPGWGDNMAALDTVVNTFGGQWFDMNWKAQLTSPPFVEATTSTSTWSASTASRARPTTASTSC